jgi:hypothetical protein
MRKQSILVRLFVTVTKYLTQTTKVRKDYFGSWFQFVRVGRAWWSRAAHILAARERDRDRETEGEGERVNDYHGWEGMVEQSSSHTGSQRERQWTVRLDLLRAQGCHCNCQPGPYAQQGTRMTVLTLGIWTGHWGAMSMSSER